MTFAHGYLWLLYVACVISITYTTTLVCDPPSTFLIEPKNSTLLRIKGQSNVNCPGLLNVEIPTELYKDNLTQWVLKVKPDPPMPCSKYAVNIGDKAHRLRELCGESFKNGFESRTRLLEIQVIFVDKNLRAGNGVYLNITAEPVCGGFFNETDGNSGRFTSPNFGSQDGYYNQYDCMYNFVAPKGKKVKVFCGTFELEDRKDGKCSDIFSVVGEERAVVTHYCGTELQKPIISDSRFLTINFQTDTNLNNYTGFDCLYNYF